MVYAEAIFTQVHETLNSVMQQQLTGDCTVTHLILCP